jgi:hypothetical protein
MGSSLRHGRRVGETITLSARSDCSSRDRRAAQRLQGAGYRAAESACRKDADSFFMSSMKAWKSGS